MNFSEWRKKYYPNETDESTLKKMSHAWAAGHVDMGNAQADIIECSEICPLCEQELPKVGPLLCVASNQTGSLDRRYDADSSLEDHLTFEHDIKRGK